MEYNVLHEGKNAETRPMGTKQIEYELLRTFSLKAKSKGNLYSDASERRGHVV
jgi:hypothetical protein